jgi:hypothetical protein
VRFLGSNVFNGHVTIPESASHDPFIALSAMYAQKIINFLHDPHSPSL